MLIYVFHKEIKNIAFPTKFRLWRVLDSFLIICLRHTFTHFSKILLTLGTLKFSSVELFQVFFQNIFSWSVFGLSALAEGPMDSRSCVRASVRVCVRV